MRRKMIRDKKGRLVDHNDIELTTTTKADEIIKMFKEQVFRSSKTGGVSQEDRGHRATKIICTLGQQNKTTPKIKELMQAGMDVARLNMDYFTPSEMRKVLEQIHIASDELGTSCPIFIDLKGMLVRTLLKNKPIQLVPGKPVYIGDDPSMAGKYENLVIIDCKKFAAKLRKGDKVTFNYGQVELVVKSFVPI